MFIQLSAIFFRSLSHCVRIRFFVPCRAATCTLYFYHSLFSVGFCVNVCVVSNFLRLLLLACMYTCIASRICHTIITIYWLCSSPEFRLDKWMQTHTHKYTYDFKFNGACNNINRDGEKMNCKLGLSFSYSRKAACRCLRVSQNIYMN